MNQAISEELLENVRIVTHQMRHNCVNAKTVDEAIEIITRETELSNNEALEAILYIANNR